MKLLSFESTQTRSALNEMTELTDHESGVAWSAQYKAWGEAREAISEAGRRAVFSNPIRFQGQYFDEETGLHYNRYRYYEPQSGSFVSNDPIKLAEFVDALYAGVQDFIAAGKNLKIPDSVSSDLNLAIDELVKAKSR